MIEKELIKVIRKQFVLDWDGFHGVLQRSICKLKFSSISVAVFFGVHGRDLPL